MRLPCRPPPQWGAPKPLAPSSSRGKARRAAPPPHRWSVRGGQGRHRQGSGCGGGAAERVGAGVLLSCIFSRLQRRNFSTGSGAWGSGPATTARAAGRAGEQRTSRQVSWARIGPWRLNSFPRLPYYRTGLVCLHRETSPLGQPGPSGFWNSRLRGGDLKENF